MNRIEKKFNELQSSKKKAFVAFITAGDPNLKITEELVLSFEKSGVDVIELGIPFSDPMADGPTIQASSQRALEQGTTLKKVFQMVKRIRRVSNIPISFMMYYNAIFHYGEEEFIAKVKDVGVDGLIIPDLPPEEAKSLIKLSRQNDISTIFFLAPTTTKERMKKVVRESTGFIYYVSIAGVTGARKRLTQSYRQQVQMAKKFTQMPVCVGFGISEPKQVKEISKVADGVIVGSAIVNKINALKGDNKIVEKVARYVTSLAAPLS